MTNQADTDEILAYEAQPRPNMQDLLRADTNAVPGVMEEVSSEHIENVGLAPHRYLSDAFHRLEVEKVWKKVWQMACREEDLPEPGDHVVYDIVGYSVLVVRQADASIKAFLNACLHRGRQLRECDGSVEDFRCAFHGFTWNLDGSLKEIPCAWDFKHVEPDKFALPEIRSARWGGFVFINLDADAESLEDFLEGLPEHFSGRWDLANRYKAAHVAKVIPANWKAVQEAFMESHHLVATHPQTVEYMGDACAQYDIYPGKKHFSRMLMPVGISSPYLGAPVSQQAIADAMQRDGARGYAGETGEDGEKVFLEIPDGMTARSFMAEQSRQALSDAYRKNLDDLSDSELLDVILYNVFPNWAPWANFGNPIVYRWRPNGDDPNSCIMEIMLLHPVPDGASRPEAAMIHWLGPDDSWTRAEELGARLGVIVDQDVSNLQAVQAGMRALDLHGGRLSLANYQEARIRHFHRTLDWYLCK